MVSTGLAVVVHFSTLVSASAYSNNHATHHYRQDWRSTRLASVQHASSTVDTTSPVLPGVATFESWFQKLSGATCCTSVVHSTFGRGALRGLAWKSTTSPGTPVPIAKTLLATIPSSAVLKSDYNVDTWDADLACRLWHEVRKGSDSRVAGYVSLLTQGDNVPAISGSEVPASTALNAVRHWTVAQREHLQTCNAGQRVLDLSQSQEAKWKEKYSKLGDSSVDSSVPTWEQFRWCMEVVHSRAFCGVSTSGTVSLLPSIVAPLVASYAGYLYTSSQVNASYGVLALLATIAIAPTLVGILRPSSRAAVLLPLIDSANHFESADSTIDFNVLANAFELSIGPNCIKEEADGQQQLYISYGRKSDTELLLNYGFLPDVPCDNIDNDMLRRQMADAFVKRNN